MVLNIWRTEKLAIDSTDYLLDTVVLENINSIINKAGDEVINKW